MICRYSTIGAVSLFALWSIVELSHFEWLRFAMTALLALSGYAGLLLLRQIAELREQNEKISQAAEVSSWSFHRKKGELIWRGESFVIENWESPNAWTSIFSLDFAFVFSQVLGEDRLIEKGLGILLRESTERGGGWFQLTGTFSKHSKDRIEGFARDVSAVSHSQMALRTREVNLDLALEAGRIVTWEWMSQERSYWVDPIWKSLFLDGPHPKEKLHWSEWLEGADYFRLLRLLAKLRLAKIQKGEVEFSCRFKKETYRLKMIAKISDRDFEGRVQKITGLIQDVSADYRAKRSVEEIAANYRMLWDENLVGMCIHREGEVVDINDTLLKMMGWSRKRALGVHLTEIIVPEEREQLAQIIKKKQGTYRGNAIGSRGEPIPIEAQAKDIVLRGQPFRLVLIEDVSRRYRAERALEASQRQLRGILDGMQEVIFMASLEGKLLEIAETEGGRQRPEMFGGLNLYLWDFTSLRKAEVLEAFQRASNETSGVRLEFSIEFEGHRHFFQMGISRLNDEKIVCVCSNQTAVVEALEQIKLSEVRFRTMASLAEEMVIFHKNWVITDANLATERIFGYTADELLGKPLSELLVERSFKDLQINHDLQNDATYELVGVRASGKEIPLQSMTKSLDSDMSQGVVILNDITERKKIEDALKKMATFDSLTNLPNRVLFTDRLQRALLQADRSKHSVGMVVLDLDGFKSVNDTYGHQAGDDLLVEVARRLPQCLRMNDTVARMGGDEFAILLPGIEERKVAELVARRLISDIEKSIETRAGQVNVSASVGFSFYPQDGRTQESIYKAADMAMYRAKTNGKGCYFFYEDLNSECE